MADYPYLSNFERAVDVALEQPYLEINSYFRRNSDPEGEEKVFETLSYFDLINLAGWVKQPTLMAIGLIDQVTPPSTVFAAYNHLETDKELKVYRYFGHEFIPAFQTEKLSFYKSICFYQHKARQRAKMTFILALCLSAIGAISLITGVLSCFSSGTNAVTIRARAVMM